MNPKSAHINRIIPVFPAFYFIVCLFIAGQTRAQDTLKIPNLEAFAPYKPTLSDAVKIESHPILEKPEIAPPVLNYAIPDIQLKTAPKFTPSKPVALGAYTPSKLYGNHSRIGFGNYSTPLIEVYLSALRSKNYAGGINYKHLSSSGKPEFADFSDNSLSAFGKKFMSSGVLGADASYSRNAVNFYGFDHETDTFKKEDVKQVFNTVETKLFFQRFIKDSTDLRVSTGFDFYNHHSRNKLNEFDLLFYGNVGKTIGGNLLNIFTSVDFTNFKNDTLSGYKRTFINVNPRYNLKVRDMQLEAGFNSTYFLDSGSGNNKFYLAPVLKATYRLIPGLVTAFGGMEGGLQKNSFRSLTGENPFLVDNFELKNTFTSIRFFGGITGNISKNLEYVVELSAKKIDRLHLFLSDTSPFRKFVVLYEDPANVTTFKTELLYKFDEKLRVSLVAEFFNYSLPVQEKAWQRPTAQFKFNATYNLGDKLYLTADIFAVNRRFSQVAFLTPVPTPVQFNGYGDFNLGLDYRYKKYLSFFLKSNNISSVRYQKWYNYPVYGINVIGGITFSF